MTSIEWTEATWNPTTGCDRVSDGCDNCLAPNTRVLMADMTWTRIEKISVGDKLVSFTDEPSVGQNRAWEIGEVLAVWETEKPTVEFELTTGARIIASEDHRWLIAQRGRNTWWRKTIDLTFKTSIRTVPCRHTDTDHIGYRAGYVAGVTAGDGTFRPQAEAGQQVYWRVAKPERDRVVLDRLVEYLASLGVEVNIRPFNGGTSGFTDTPMPMMKVETRRSTALADIAGMCNEQETRQWMTGYLAGMFDTDGFYNRNLRFCQSKPNDVLDNVVRYGKELGFDLRREDWESSCPTVRLYGGVPENIGFLSAISPALTRRCQDFYGRRVDAYDSPVVAIRRGPVRRLIDITTSTGTFVVEGALTHNCYALSMAARLKAMGQPKYQNDGDPRTSGPGFGLTLHPDTLDMPRRWRKPRVIFVNSMSDLFHAKVPLSFVRDVFTVIRETPQHTYQVLTKRALRLRRVADQLDWPPNLWMGVSVENAAVLDRVDHLREVPAAVRFLSCEPLIGPLGGIDLAGIHWVIAGGESGAEHRPMDPDWARYLRDTCTSTDTAFFFKQWGGRTPKSGGRLLDGRTWDQYPTTEVAAR